MRSLSATPRASSLSLSSCEGPASRAAASTAKAAAVTTGQPYRGLLPPSSKRSMVCDAAASPAAGPLR